MSYIDSQTALTTNQMQFLEMISLIKSKINSIEGPTPEMYICGDFNIAHTITEDVYRPTQNCNYQLVNILNDFMNLTQIIHKPTHSNGHILDIY